MLDMNPKYLIVKLQLALFVDTNFDENFQNDPEFRKEMLDAIETNILNGYYRIEEESK
jgi:hypothetical protein